MSAASSGVATESDFTLRQLRIGGVCLFGQTFASYVLIFGPLILLMLPMTQELHWSRTQFSYAMSSVMWFSALGGPCLGRWVDRWGVRPVVLGSTALMAVATLALSRTSHLWQFYLGYAAVGFFGASQIGYTKVVGATFTRNRGRAFALLMAMITMVSSVYPVVTNLILQRLGWRGVFVIYGCQILVVLVILFFTLEDPIPRQPPGENAEGGPPAVPLPVMEGLTPSQARRDRAFWTLVGAGLLTGALGAGWAQHQVAFLTLGRGFSQQQVVYALSLAMLVSPLIALLGGWLVDRVQSARIGAPFALLTGLGILGQGLVASHRGGMPLLLISVYLGFIVISAQMPMAQYFFSRYFGMKAFGEIFGYYMSLLALVMGFSPPLIGLLFERTGSYNIALRLMIVGDVAAALLFLTLGRYRYSVDMKPGAAKQPDEALENGEPPAALSQSIAG